MIHIYALPLHWVFLIIVATVSVWTALLRFLKPKTMRVTAMLFLTFAFYAVLRYSVLQRTPSNQHLISFFSKYCCNPLYTCKFRSASTTCTEI